MRTELAICEGLVFSVWVPILSQIDRKNAKKHAIRQAYRRRRAICELLAIY